MSRSHSILIPSFGRPLSLEKCLASLNVQTTPPDEVMVCWQGPDVATRDALERIKPSMRFELRIIRSAEPGIVPAENAALEVARGEIILLIDDDAIAPPDWIARHLAHYDDPTIGAVGGPAVNHRPDGSPFPTRDKEPIGKLCRTGRVIGNMFDHPASWRARPAIDVDHLVGYNMSLRRSAFGQFESRLKPYWQMFELDACLQAKSRGFRVRFDFANVVDHFPTNTAYVGGREGDLEIKIYNAAYNHALLLAKHRRGFWERVLRQLYECGVGAVGMPGLIAALVAMFRFGHPARECSIAWNTAKARRAGRHDAMCELSRRPHGE